MTNTHTNTNTHNTHNERQAPTGRPPGRSGACLAIAAFLLVGGPAALEGGVGVTRASAATAKRPSITITLSDTTVEIPKVIPGGYVDVTLSATSSRKQGHHLAFLRRNQGVSVAQLEAAPDDKVDALVTYQGGNGSVNPGKTAHLTLDLDPGDYVVFDFIDGPPIVSRTTVTGPAVRTTKPVARGTITMGPGMRYTVPKNFDGSGVWRFSNADTTKHEAVLVRLAPGKTVQDLFAWGKTAESSPPPGDIVGGFGALGSGRQGWIDLGAKPTPGRYALACILPTGDGSTHLGMGMAVGLAIV